MLYFTCNHGLNSDVLLTVCLVVVRWLSQVNHLSLSKLSRAIVFFAVCILEKYGLGKSRQKIEYYENVCFLQCFEAVGDRKVHCVPLNQMLFSENSRVGKFLPRAV